MENSKFVDATRVDTFLLLLLLLSIFVNFITKKACYTSPDGISITFHRCDLYDGLDSFVLSTFHRIKLKYVTRTKKSVCLLLLLLCEATLNYNRARLTIVNLRHSYRKKELIFVIKICMEIYVYGKLNEVREILLSYNFDIFSLSETSISEDFYNAFFDIRGYRFIRRDRKIDQVGGVGL